MVTAVTDTGSPTKMHNPKLFEDKVLTAHPRPSHHSRHVSYPPHSSVGLKNGGGSGFTHTAHLGKVSNLCFIKRALLVRSVHQVPEVSDSWFQSLLPPRWRDGS